MAELNQALPVNEVVEEEEIVEQVEEQDDFQFAIDLLAKSFTGMELWTSRQETTKGDRLLTMYYRGDDDPKVEDFATFAELAETLHDAAKSRKEMITYTFSHNGTQLRISLISVHVDYIVFAVATRYSVPKLQSSVIQRNQRITNSTAGLNASSGVVARKKLAFGR